MNLTEIAELTATMGMHRLRMSAAAGAGMGMFCDLYTGGKPALSILALEGTGQRELVNKAAAALGIETVSLTVPL